MTHIINKSSYSLIKRNEKYVFFIRHLFQINVITVLNQPKWVFQQSIYTEASADTFKVLFVYHQSAHYIPDNTWQS